MAENNQTFAVPYEVHARQQLAAEMQALQEKPLDETVPGGRYIGADGKEHDAEGRPVKAQRAAPASEPAPSDGDLPEDFPGRRALVSAGVITLDQVRGLDRDALIALKGIGEATADEILEVRG